MNRTLRIVIPMCLIGVLSWTTMDGCMASTITFQGQNPALFPGANPNNTAAMMSTVVKPHDPNAGNANVLNPATLIQQAVQGQISSQITTDIFNKSNTNGSFDLGGGNTISFTRASGLLNITIVDPVHGTTHISLPDL